MSPRSYLYFEVVVGRAWKNDPAGSSVATVSVTQAGQVKGDYLDKNRYHDPAGWVLGFGREAD
jgi:hypothetical protein